MIGNVGLENGHVIAQDGIYAGSQNQFHVDNAGNVSTEGDISGANGTFTGKVSGEAGSFNSVTANQAAFGRVDVAGDATVSGNLDVGSLTINGSELADVATVDDVKAQIGYDKTTNKYAEITATNAEGKKAETLTEAVNTNNSMIHENAVAIQNNSNAISSLGNRVSDLGDEIDNVGAISAALAGLHPLDYDGTGSKFQLSAAMGTYDGSQAAAIGAFYHFNRDVMISLGGATAFDGDHKTAGNLGVTFRVGAGASGKAVSDDVMARLEAMDQKIAALEQENRDLKNVLGAIDTSLSKEFPDVPANHWAYEAVTKLAGNDVVAGYPDGEFHGDRTMTRYEMAEVIYKAMQKGAKVDQKLVNEFKPEMEQVAANQNA
ncbi:S-layer homology domain-containing protein [uncultured Megasphaera sp.]|uniref:S-layer homology domain-containing protein n=1 Tax=uncultured Megasphaera sp. TaxID=165188 RepID=UPI0025968DA3|nr:S-layer homology domain-containing protein [uncultured Megasphaera sp.]